jgi:protein involved in polysaccharide export with SLBB domain
MGVVMKTFFNCGAILALGLQLAGCYTDYGPVLADPVPPIPASAATRLQAGDKVKVTVYGEENLTGIYDINPAGYIEMPLAGATRAAGRTPPELARAIENRYSPRYLQDPKVTVEIVTLRPFYIFGEVEHPGQYPYAAGLNVISAASTAGGFTYRASKSAVLIQHAGEPVWQEYSLAQPITVMPGDIIRVPERYF